MIDGVEFKAHIKEDDFSENITVEVTAIVRRVIHFSRTSGLSKTEAIEVAMQRLGHTFEHEIFR